MKAKITPLNILTALAFALFVLSFFKAQTDRAPVDSSFFYRLILACLIGVTFITDLVFRFSLKTLRKIWLVETVFILVTVILMLILQKFV
ncbi:hypothetical protein [Pedobacter sp. MW01-1-1]|uniref:hypothetical protein n=1 Tax=Pedobacter sp. MW01-1-1 TaxID=3383027 RepID=UPI003FEEEB34